MKSRSSASGFSEKMMPREQKRIIGDPVSRSAIEFIEKVSFSHFAPGSVVADARILIDYITANKLQRARNSCQLPLGKLDEINSILTKPLPHGLKRAQQRSLPNIHGLYLLLRASGLVKICGKQFSIDSKILDCWISMNPTEQYFALLAAWLVQAAPKILGVDTSRRYYFGTELIDAKRRLQSDSTCLVADLLTSTDLKMTAALMEMFGWIDINYGPAENGKGPQAHSARWLPFGRAMLEPLEHFWLNFGMFQITERPETEAALMAYFTPARPELVKRLPPDEPTNNQGTLVWKVSIGSVWRRIEINSSNTLKALADTILSAFNFDDEHLYCFEVLDLRGRLMRFEHPDHDLFDGPADSVELGQLPLSCGDHILFWYDFGDDWKFDVVLEAIREQSTVRKPKIIERSGKAPRQYPRYDD